jgi:Cft2 family RNA processing exonuclease
MEERCRLLVRESTYVNETFEDRQKIEERMIEAAEAVLRPPRSGKLLIASLSVDRMQDAFSILNEAGVEPLYIDGAKTATSIYLRYLAAKASPLKRALAFKNQRDRDKLRLNGKPAVVISSSGMIFPNTLSAMWAENFLYDANNAIFLVNHQDPTGQGHILTESANGDFIRFNNMIVHRACQIEQFNLSAHMDKTEGERLENRLRPDVIIYTHGEDAKIQQYINEHNDGKKRVKARAGEEVEL